MIQSKYRCNPNLAFGLHVQVRLRMLNGTARSFVKKHPDQIRTTPSFYLGSHRSKATSARSWPQAQPLGWRAIESRVVRALPGARSRGAAWAVSAAPASTGPTQFGLVSRVARVGIARDRPYHPIEEEIRH